MSGQCTVCGSENNKNLTRTYSGDWLCDACWISLWPNDHLNKAEPMWSIAVVPVTEPEAPPIDVLRKRIIREED